MLGPGAFARRATSTWASASLARPIAASRPTVCNKCFPRMQTFPAPRSLSQIPPPGSEAYKRLREAQPLFVASKNGGTDRSSRRRFRLPRIRTIVLSSVAAATAFFWYHLETVPVSGRRRFNFYPEHFIAKISSWQARALEQEIESKGGRFLPESDERTRLVRRVMARLIPVSGGGKLVDHTLPQDGSGERGRESATEGAHSNADEVQWEVRVIDDPTTANAFVLPGGKVFVFSGILHAANTEAGLAAVLGHEIAHNMAAHVAERLSDDFGTNIVFYTTFVLSWGATLFLFSIFGDMKSLLLTMPMSRKQESEADYIGLMLMAEACYDPRAALGFWQRMSRLAKAHGGEPPELLSTHPSNESRIEKIAEWMPEAMEKWQNSSCHGTSTFADAFRRALATGSVLT